MFLWIGEVGRSKLAEELRRTPGQLTCAVRICPIDSGRRGSWGKEMAKDINGLKT